MPPFDLSLWWMITSNSVFPPEDEHLTQSALSGARPCCFEWSIGPTTGSVHNLSLWFFGRLSCQLPAPVHFPMASFWADLRRKCTCVSADSTGVTLAYFGSYLLPDQSGYVKMNCTGMLSSGNQGPQLCTGTIVLSLLFGSLTYTYFACLGHICFVYLILCKQFIFAFCI